MDAAANITMKNTKEKIQTLIETSIIQNRQIKQCVYSIVPVKNLSGNPNLKNIKTSVCYREHIEDVTKQLASIINALFMNEILELKNEIAETKRKHQTVISKT